MFEGEGGRDGGWEERGGSYESPPLNTKQLFPEQLLNDILHCLPILIFPLEKSVSRSVVVLLGIGFYKLEKEKKHPAAAAPIKGHDIMVNTVRKKS